MTAFGVGFSFAEWGRCQPAPPPRIMFWEVEWGEQAGAASSDQYLKRKVAPKVRGAPRNASSTPVALVGTFWKPESNAICL